MIDLKDKKILYELSSNARITNKELAKAIYLSESSTKNRVDNLMEKKIILGTEPIIDNSKLGYQGYRIYFNFVSTTIKEEEEILEWLKKHKSVSVLAKCSGNIDVAIMSWVKKRVEFENLIEEIKGHFKDKIDNLEVSIYCETYHFDRAYLLEKHQQRKIIKIGNNELADFDELDKQILQILLNDARISILNISEKLKIPPRTIAFRVRQMEKKKIIAGYTLNLNHELIDYEYYKLNLMLSGNINKQNLINFASSQKNNIYLDVASGKFDLELNLEVRNKEELRSIINNVKDTFGGIKQIQMFQIEKYLKISYM
ncbi:MAG: Lrp/AsnC family transcriptional regulator [Nanoarchaeota archaeon]